MIDVSETLHSQRERGRVHAQGRRTDDNNHHILLTGNESDRSWVIHVPGVRLSQPVMVAVAESILGRAR